MLRVEKVSRSKEKKIKLFIECQIVTLGKHISLPSARQLHSGNIFLCRVPFFTECFLSNLPSVELCRVFFASFAECIYFAECFFAALGKWLVCRVPEEMHSANIKTLGK